MCSVYDDTKPDIMNKERVILKTLYQRRLSFFGFGSGDKLVESRLSQSGSHVYLLPKLFIDGEIQHRLSNRCVFKNQRPFIGGDLERFCV
ncbi:hypothetical protein SAMN06296036_1573 [Pseudobacteriovorax antillogorgiicola]|uniref:Uncharacterized protein n=1 Tax=Pseudobacteriovorax antillogorgiicola TaxID=1513793 RepID=A0A1Y6CSF2_9BACT|nr:hypothetical protein EDD56_1552 [Pseudobacteriovorax antillogorgiicola]SMF84554.1 hypothetical protein SAMN06296036_1573 [Pseudobacteriovorax antillogorgiicola]